MIKKMKWIGRPKLMIYLCLAILLIMLAVLGLDRYVADTGRRRIILPYEAGVVDAIIVPGAKINPDGSPSDMLKDRLDAALALWVNKRADLILVSGDGRESASNETAAMAQYLQSAGVPADHILIDPCGYDTFQTVLRAHRVYPVRTSIMTTQTYHLERALYIADVLDADMLGVASDFRPYASLPLMRLREVLARVKALYECTVFRLSGS